MDTEIRVYKKLALEKKVPQPLLLGLLTCDLLSMSSVHYHQNPHKGVN